MALLNLRMGFATNSSSSHSIVILADKNAQYSSDEYHRFEWNTFIAADETSKRNYLAACVATALYGDGHLSDYQRALMAHALVGSDEKPVKSTDENGYVSVDAPSVDHQSVLALPFTRESFENHDSLSEEFLDDLLAFMLRKDVVILGGNDNGDSARDLRASVEGTDVDLPTESRSWRCRKEAHKVWTLFDKHSGSRLTVDFNGDDVVNRGAFSKLANPLLVDMKITDYCAFGCTYCYQGSTAKGAHADYSVVRDFIEACSRMLVFEIAIGGGEPTTHPEFMRIIEAANNECITVNFTTRNKSFFTPANVKELKLDQFYTRKVGGIAVSVDSLQDVKDWEKHINEVREKLEWQGLYGMNLQVVLGAMPLEELVRIFKYVGNYNRKGKVFGTITLLGWKTTGRGSLVQPYNVKGWTKILNNRADYYVRTGVDTQIASEYEEELKKAGVPEELYSLEEGKQSMYIDAVTKVAAPSSFCDPSKNVRLDLNKYAWSRALTDAFKGF